VPTNAHKVTLFYKHNCEGGAEQAPFRDYNNKEGIWWGSTFGSPIIFGDFGGREESNPGPLPDVLVIYWEVMYGTCYVQAEG
jgi:hypothetical protein